MHFYYSYQQPADVPVRCGGGGGPPHPGGGGQKLRPAKNEQNMHIHFPTFTHMLVP